MIMKKLCRLQLRVVIRWLFASKKKTTPFRHPIHRLILPQLRAKSPYPILNFAVFVMRAKAGNDRLPKALIVQNKKSVAKKVE